jgi:sugar phosphate isomerase/epimerase
MKIGLFTDSLADLSFEEALDWAAAQGLQAVEIGTGNFSPAPHCDLQKLIDDQQARQQFLRALASRGLELSALNCNGNLLDPHPDRRNRAQQVFQDTLKAAHLLGIQTVVTMSGCPGDLEGGTLSQLGDLHLAAGIRGTAGAAVGAGDRPFWSRLPGPPSSWGSGSPLRCTRSGCVYTHAAAPPTDLR